jgi:hypothetical protein
MPLTAGGAKLPHALGGAMVEAGSESRAKPPHSASLVSRYAVAVVRATHFVVNAR